VVDRAYLLEVGTIKLTGAAAELREHQFVRQAYLGM
jgi:ABC-type lipopolysaccharide export system ATPase subunit